MILEDGEPGFQHEPGIRRFRCNPTELCCSEPCREDTATVAWATVEAVLPQAKTTEEEILRRVLDPIQAHTDQLRQGTEYTFSERSSSFSDDDMLASNLQTTTPEMKRPRPPGVPPLAIPAGVAAMVNSGRTAKFGRSPTDSLDGVLCLSTGCCGKHTMAELNEDLSTFVSCRQWDTALQSPHRLYSEELQALPEKLEEVASCQEASEGLATRASVAAAHRREQPPLLCREPLAEPPPEPPAERPAEPPAEPLAQPLICREFTCPSVEASPEKVRLGPTQALALVGVSKGKLGGA